MIMDLNEKMKETGNEIHDSKNASRSFPKTTTMKPPVNNNNEYNNNSKVTKKFSDLYLKAVETKDDKEDDYESVIDDDDNDSFITIESDAESDVTLGHEDQSSSDSGYTDIAEAPAPASSYGVNPMFARHSQGGGQGDGTESCEDFVFYNSGKGQF